MYLFSAEVCTSWWGRLIFPDSTTSHVPTSVLAECMRNGLRRKLKGESWLLQHPITSCLRVTCLHTQHSALTCSCPPLTIQLQNHQASLLAKTIRRRHSETSPQALEDLLGKLITMPASSPAPLVLPLPGHHPYSLATLRPWALFSLPFILQYQGTRTDFPPSVHFG